MRELLADLDRWQQDGRTAALATVVRVWGSAPRPLGAKMAVDDRGAMIGSVSGGCIEGAVAEEAQQVLAQGTPRLVSFGVSDETAWSVGLSCGGEIEVFIEPWLQASGPSRVQQALRRCLDDEVVAVCATLLAGPDAGARLLVPAPAPGGTREAEGEGWVGGVGESALDGALAVRARACLARFASARERVPGNDAAEHDVFLELHAPRPVLIVVGAVHVAITLVRFAAALGFRTVVVDPRTAFATPERFAHADQLITRWPDEALEAVGLHANTFVALLSHDLKLDVPALRVALESPARYIGALGSRKTHGKRLEALRAAGVDEGALQRIHNPIGLPLGGRRAEEMAVSILAEIVAVQHGRRLQRAPEPASPTPGPSGQKG